MIDAFKSTLEESLAADLILLFLIDASDEIEDIRIKYESCWDVLDDLKVDKSKVAALFNPYYTTIRKSPMTQFRSGTLKDRRNTK